MWSTVFKFPIFLLVILASSGTWANPTDIKKLNKSRWFQIDSPNFHIVTDASESKAKSMATELERFYYFTTKMLGYKQQPLPSKVPIVAAKSSSTLKAMGIDKMWGGVFSQRGLERAIIAKVQGFSSNSANRPNHARQTLLHEITHLIMNNAELNIELAPWYTEGIAEYFGTYLEKKNKIVLGDMSLLRDNFYLLSRPTGGLESVDVESLVKATSVGATGSSSRSENRTVAKFYARSFGFVHYLNADPKRRVDALKYLYAVKKGYGHEDSFVAVFERSFDDMSREVDRYLSGKNVLARVFNKDKNGIVFPQFSVTSKKITSKEALVTVVNTVGMLNNSVFMSADDVEDMYQQVESIYPDFFGS